MQDYTKVKTVFKRRLRSISLRLDDRYLSDPTAPLIVRDADTVHQVITKIYERFDDNQEHLIMLCLNQRNEVTGYKHLFSGGQDSSTVDCKIIFRSALLLGARQIIIAHNHPSGCLNPSEEDLAVTRQISNAGYISDIPLIDHIIHTRNGYTSIRDIRPSLFHERGSRLSTYEPSGGYP